MKLRAGPAALWGVAGLLAAAAAFAKPFGASTDEALFLILARALRAGSFAVPGPLGWVVTDPWPGYPLLLSPFELVLGAHWPLYRLVGLAAWAALTAGAWALCRRAGEKEAQAAALLTAISPAALGQAGQLTPDVAFAALAAIALAAFARRGPAWTWAAPAALAAITRPHGALLLAALEAAALLKKRRRDAAAAVVAALPLLALLLRNRLVAGTVTDYAAHWREQAAPRAVEVLGVVVGQGFCGLGARAGAVVLVALAWALARWARRDREGGALAAALFGAGVLALHLTWGTATPRYALPLAPLLFAALAFSGKRAVWLAAAALAPLSLLAGLREARGGPTLEIVQPETMAWVAEHTPADARLESFASPPIMLFTGRAAAAPARRADARDAWLASLLERKISYVHVFGLRAEGYLPGEVRALAERREGWARSLPYFRVVYENPAEGSALFSFAHPSPERFLAGWAAFERAGALARAGGPPDEVAARLREAVGHEPDLAVAWAALAGFEKKPRARLKDFERAAAADPTNEMIREDLRAARLPLEHE